MIPAFYGNNESSSTDAKKPNLIYFSLLFADLSKDLKRPGNRLRVEVAMGEVAGLSETCQRPVDFLLQVHIANLSSRAHVVHNFR